jgi:hypothetical protein
VAICARSIVRRKFCVTFLSGVAIAPLAQSGSGVGYSRDRIKTMARSKGWKHTGLENVRTIFMARDITGS